MQLTLLVQNLSQVLCRTVKTGLISVSALLCNRTCWPSACCVHQHGCSACLPDCHRDVQRQPCRFCLADLTSLLILQVDIQSHWTWSSTLLQSANQVYQYGVSGAYWYAGAAVVQVLCFGILAVYIKVHPLPALLQRPCCGQHTHTLACRNAPPTRTRCWRLCMLAGARSLDLYSCASAARCQLALSL